jgi:hypothetical protein
MNREELGTEAAVVEDTLSIQGCPVIALIDPGSMDSFVNKTRACHLNWVGNELPYIVHVTTLLGKMVVASKYVPDCSIQVGSKELKADLIVMTIEDYDLILGMDWLSKHGARVDCKSKLVQFVRPRRNVLEFKANQIKERNFLIAGTKARKLLAKGC